MDFQTVFADSQLLVSSTKCIRSWVRLIVLQKKNLNYSKFWTEKIIVRVFPIQKKMSKISEFFMRACIRSQIFRENWSYSFTRGGQKILYLCCNLTSSFWESYACDSEIGWSANTAVTWDVTRGNLRSWISATAFLRVMQLLWSCMIWSKPVIQNPHACARVAFWDKVINTRST